MIIRTWIILLIKRNIKYINKLIFF
jgi:hypothetical protein